MTITLMNFSSLVPVRAALVPISVVLRKIHEKFINVIVIKILLGSAVVVVVCAVYFETGRVSNGRLKINGTDDNDDGTTKKDFDDYHIDEFLVPGTSTSSLSSVPFILRRVESPTALIQPGARPVKFAAWRP
jgi:hypothetical protein